MAPLDYLRRFGPAFAAELAYRLRLPLEDVYADLVHAEAEGSAFVVVTYAGHETPIRYWSAA